MAKDNKKEKSVKIEKAVKDEAKPLNISVISKGSKISVDYEGRFESGEIFDSSKHGDHSHPLDFEVGSGQVIPGFEKAVMGMHLGEEKEFVIEPSEAYGELNEELKKEIPRNSLPPEQEPKAGMTLIVSTPQGQFPVKIVDVKGDKIVIDLNHPLAGKKLIFKIKILSIK